MSAAARGLEVAGRQRIDPRGGEIEIVEGGERKLNALHFWKQRVMLAEGVAVEAAVPQPSTIKRLQGP
jgi:hypothetical protein